MAEVNGTTGDDILTGTSADDQVNAFGGNDLIKGGAGADIVDGGTGSDRVEFQFSANGTGLSGFTGNRTFVVTASSVTDSAGQINTSFTNIEGVSFDTNAFNFGAGSGQAVFTGFSTGTTTFDASAFTGSGGVSVNNAPRSNNIIFTGSAAGDSVAVGLGAHVLDGGAGVDRAQIILNGTTSTTITQTGSTLRATTGSTFSDITNFEQVSFSLQSNGGASINAAGVTAALTFSVSFGTPSQSVTGGSGNDRFENHFSGGPTTIGTTTMTGGAGADTYSYTGFGTNFDKDVITDFAAEDRIDLSLVSVFSPSTPVRFIAAAAFSNVANQVRYEKSGSTTLLQVDGNGDGVADATLTITNGAFDLRETAAGSAVLQIAGNINGTSGTDTLFGTTGADRINALEGNDRILGSTGQDVVDGGTGLDSLAFDFSIAGTGLSTTSGNRTFTVNASSVTDSAGQITTAFSNIERVEFNRTAVSFGGFSSGTTTIDASAFTGVSGISVGHGLNTERFVFIGSSAADFVAIGLGSHVIDGGAGSDNLFMRLNGSVDTTITQTGDRLRFTTGSEVTDVISFENVFLALQFDGGASINAAGVTSALRISVSYGPSNQSVIGGSANDRFENNSSGGSNTIGITTMTGGAGADTYSYSRFGNNFDRDVITDFAPEDRIDLSQVGQFNPANPARFIGTAAFTSVANQVRYVKSGNTTLLQVDGDGDGVADATLTISNGAFDLRETATGSAILAIAPEIVGTAGNDRLSSNNQSRVIRALAGDDTISEFGSSEFIDGGDGYDIIIYFYDGVTTPVIADFSSFVPSSVAVSFSDGRGGTDLLVNIEEVHLYGGSGNDRLTGPATVRTFIEGGEGADTITGGSGNDVLFGDAFLSATDGGDTISAGAGNDYIEGGRGGDIIDGGDGFDTIGFDLSESSSAPGAVRTLDISALSASATGQQISDASGAVDTVRNIEATAIYSSGLGDTIVGSAALPNTFYLSNGNDTVTGGAAADRFEFTTRGFGLDRIFNFRPGSDKIDLREVGVTSFEALRPFIAQVGPDTVITLGFNGATESITLKGVTASQLTGADFEFSTAAGGPVGGSAGGDVLFGSAGSDVIQGLAGDDTINAAAGSDTISGGAGLDVVIFSATRAAANVTRNSDGTVTVSSSVDGTDTVSGVELFRFADETVSFAFADAGTPRVANFGVGAGGWSSQDRFPRQVADVNGDGFADIIGFGQAGTLVSLGSAAGTFANPFLAVANFGANQGWTSDNIFHRELADVNNDGRADIVGFGTAGVLISLAQANGSFSEARLASNNFNPANGWGTQDGFSRTVADVNGDGFADIVGFGVPGTFVALGNGSGAFGTATLVIGNFGANQGWTSSNLFHREVGDVNGDGRADLVGFGTAGTLVALGQANGSFAAPFLALGNFGTNQGWSTQDAFTRDLGDVNGDGRDDVVGFGVAGTFVAYGQADGTFSPAVFDTANFGQNQGWTSNSLFHRELADFNGDGREDIFGFGFDGVFVASAFDGVVI